MCNHEHGIVDTEIADCILRLKHHVNDVFSLGYFDTPQEQYGDILFFYFLNTLSCIENNKS